jgi:hypothetical protein
MISVMSWQRFAQQLSIPGRTKRVGYRFASNRSTGSTLGSDPKIHAT